jgi:hypothetical protein
MGDTPQLRGNFLVYFSIRGGYRNGYPFLPVALKNGNKMANTESIIIKLVPKKGLKPHSYQWSRRASVS